MSDESAIVTARIESEADPRQAGRTAYRISAASEGSVQEAIDRLMMTVEDIGGCASFTLPARVNGGFCALGFTVMQGRS